MEEIIERFKHMAFVNVIGATPTIDGFDIIATESTYSSLIDGFIDTINKEHLWEKEIYDYAVEWKESRQLIYSFYTREYWGLSDNRRQKNENSDIKNSIDTAKREGKEDGRAEGREEEREKNRMEKENCIRKMLKDGISPEQIASWLAVPLEDVTEIRKI